MASKRAQPSLDEVLADEGFRFQFFQAVRLLMRLAPDRKPVGYDDPPGDEVVRFRAHVSNDFPPSPVDDVNFGTDSDSPAEMIVNFMGLTGPQGALPAHYTHLMMERVRRRDFALRDFLDLFNHRLISLFYRAWEKYQLGPMFERSMRHVESARRKGGAEHRAAVMQHAARIDPFSQMVLDFAGMGEPALRYEGTQRRELAARTDVDDDLARFFAGLLAQQHRSAVSLEGMIGEVFGWPVEVDQFSGRWLALDPEDQTQLLPGGNTQLGVTAIAGERVWDIQGAFRIRVGPLKYDQFYDLLPLGTAHRPLGHLVRLYAGPSLDFGFELVLLAQEAPLCQMGAAGPAAPRLGWNTWIRSQVLTRDPSVVLNWQDN